MIVDEAKMLLKIKTKKIGQQNASLLKSFTSKMIMRF